MQPSRIILASGSAARREMLHAAGVTFDVVPAVVDEAALRAELSHKSPPPTATAIAEALAAAKARDVAATHSAAIVIGSDQILEIDGELLSKPDDAAGVRATLQKLSGRTHALHSAVALAIAGRIVWTASDTARLTMRRLSSRFIDDYIARAGAGVHACVGAYRIEGLGIQLFDKIDGDHFTILGMPLLPLLAQLRSEGALPA